MSLYVGDKVHGTATLSLVAGNVDKRHQRNLEVTVSESKYVPSLFRRFS